MATKTRPPAIGLFAYVIGAFALLGVAVWGWVEWSPSRQRAGQAPLTKEAKAYTQHLRLSDVTMKANKSYLNQMVVEIEGKIGNAGDRILAQVEIYCVFYDRYGQTVLRQRVPIVSPRMGGLKPSESKPFRLPFDDLPESWNQQMPQLVIAGIKFL